MSISLVLIVDLRARTQHVEIEASEASYPKATSNNDNDSDIFTNEEIRKRLALDMPRAQEENGCSPRCAPCELSYSFFDQ